MAGRFWRIVTAVTIWHIAASVCYYAVYAGTPLFRDAFSLSGVEVGLIITALTLGYAMFLLPFGIVTDRFGEHRTLTGGLAGLSLGILAVAIAPTYPLLLVAAFLLGTMYGSATPGTNKAIFDQIEAGRQYRAMGVKQIGPTIGGAIGALVVTGLAGVAFWQFGFLVAAAFGLLVTVVFGLVYRGGDGIEATYPDFRGLLSNPPYVVLLLAGVCIGSAFYTTTGYVVLFMNESIGSSVAVGGLALAVLQVSSSVGKVVTGTLADVLPGDPRTSMGAMIVVQAAGSAVLYVVLPLTSTPIAAGVVFAGIGVLVIGSTGLYYSYISTLVEHTELGAASAAGQLAMTVSGLFAPPLFGYLVDVSGYAPAWGFLGAMSFLAAILVVIVTLDIV